jgi:Zn-finger protein
MHNLAKKLIKERIQKISEDWSFEKRSKEHQNECPCYTKGKCHQLEDLNCFFCYCPEYDLTIQEGGCKIGNPKGKWFYHKDLPKRKIWDCSDCDYPHKPQNIVNYLMSLFTKG